MVVVVVAVPREPGSSGETSGVHCPCMTLSPALPPLEVSTLRVSAGETRIDLARGDIVAHAYVRGHAVERWVDSLAVIAQLAPQSPSETQDDARATLARHDVQATLREIHAGLGADRASRFLLAV